MHFHQLIRFAVVKSFFFVGKTELTLTNRSTLPISRDRVNEVKEQFMAYIVAKEGM